MPGQGNNAYIFPGVALGVIAARAKTIPDVVFLRAAQALAQYVPSSQLDVGCIYPDLKVRLVLFFYSKKKKKMF